MTEGGGRRHDDGKHSARESYDLVVRDLMLAGRTGWNLPPAGRAGGRARHHQPPPRATTSTASRARMGADDTCPAVNLASDESSVTVLRRRVPAAARRAARAAPSVRRVLAPPGHAHPRARASRAVTPASFGDEGAGAAAHAVARQVMELARAANPGARPLDRRQISRCADRRGRRLPQEHLQTGGIRLRIVPDAD